MFNIGDKVVCVGAVPGISTEHNDPRYIIGNHCVSGKVYVIEKVIFHAGWTSDMLGLSLIGGYTSWQSESLIELGFDSRCFRKLDEMKAENKAKKQQTDLIKV